MDEHVLATKPLTELKTIASSLEMRGFQRLRKAELVQAIVQRSGSTAPGAAAASGTVTRTRKRSAEPHTPPLDLDGGGNGRAETPGPRRRTRGTPDDASAPSDGEQTPVTGGARRRPNRDDAAEATGASRTRVRSRTRERTEAERTRPEREQASAQAPASAPATPPTEPSPTPAEGRDAATPAGDAAQDGQGQARRRERNRDGGGGERRQDSGGEPQRQDGGGQQRQQGPGPQQQQGPGPQQQQGSGPQQQQGSGPQQGGADDEGGGGRRRRSRRERRRNKGQGNQGNQGGQRKKGGRQIEEDLSAEPGEVRSGILDVLPEGYGFLRVSGYLPGDKDVYVSQSHVRKHGLRRGDVIEGPVRQQHNTEKVPALHHVQQVNGVKPGENGALPHRPDFKDMTPLFPEERLPLETPDGPISMRIIDLMSPIGKGQRGLIVSPPKAGKTTLLKELGQAIAFNNPECHVMVVLVDERPEEVTDMQRSVPGEIIASTFDRPADDHTQIAELAIERAKRLVERGTDVVILMDSITRLSRAYNTAAPASGRIMSGGVDSSALYPPKRFFGAARNIEHGGSLTIIASALIETGSKMDEVIFEEFKGTGNSEIRLDRRLEQKRVFPALDIDASGTRKEELLLDREELTIIWKLRRVLAALDGPAALELLIDKMRTTRSNNQFLVQIQKSNLQS